MEGNCLVGFHFFQHDVWNSKIYCAARTFDTSTVHSSSTDDMRLNRLLLRVANIWYEKKLRCFTCHPSSMRNSIFTHSQIDFPSFTIFYLFLLYFTLSSMVTIGRYRNMPYPYPPQNSGCLLLHCLMNNWHVRVVAIVKFNSPVSRIFSFSLKPQKTVEKFRGIALSVESVIYTAWKQLNLKIKKKLF